MFFDKNTSNTCLYLNCSDMPLGSLDLTNYIYITDTSLAYVGQIKM